MDAKFKLVQPMSWHPPSWRGTATQRGECCYYCLQVFRARYRHRGLNYQQLVAKLGKDSQEHRTFMTLRGSLIDTYIEAGGRIERVFGTQRL